MRPKLYLVWIRLKDDHNLRQDVILESTGAVQAKGLAAQIIADRWEVHSVELWDEE